MIWRCSGRERLVDRDHVAEFVAGDLFALHIGVTAEQPHGDVGRPRQQPHDRLGQRRQQVERPGHHHAPLLGALHRDALGRQFAEHEGEVGEDEGDQDHRDGPGRAAEEAQWLFERFGERHRRRGRGEEAGESDVLAFGEGGAVVGARVEAERGVQRPCRALHVAGGHTTDTRIVEVEIISMLTPSSASTRNILAAMPGDDFMPAPTSDTLAMSLSWVTPVAPISVGDRWTIDSACGGRPSAS
jgi:hypothetical protein